MGQAICEATSIQAKLSSYLSTIRVGIPQGSTLEPLSFSFSVNDFQVVVNNVQVKMYADDNELV